MLGQDEKKKRKAYVLHFMHMSKILLVEGANTRKKKGGGRGRGKQSQPTLLAIYYTVKPRNYGINATSLTNPNLSALFRPKITKTG